MDLQDDDWIDGFALKFYGAMRLSRAAWPYLQASRGSIVNIAGIGGRTGSADFAIGGAVNSALLNLTKALADRGVVDGIRVNAINPGSIVTDRLKLRLRTLAAEQGVDEAEAERAMTMASRVARFGEPAEIARAVAFWLRHRPIIFKALSWILMAGRREPCDIVSASCRSFRWLVA